MTYGITDHQRFAETISHCPDPDIASIHEIGSELAQLTWHLLADHTERARDQDVDASTSKKWTNASDATIVHTLAPDKMRPADRPQDPHGRMDAYFGFLTYVQEVDDDPRPTVAVVEECLNSRTL